MAPNPSLEQYSSLAVFGWFAIRPFRQEFGAMWSDGIIDQMNYWTHNKPFGQFITKDIKAE